MYTMSRRDEISLQIALIKSDDNRQYAKRYYVEHCAYDVERALSDDELAMYWVECGAAKWFRDVFLKELPFVMSEDNIWYAKEYYVKYCGYLQARTLTIIELYTYWALCGAAKWFRETYLEKFYVKTA